MSNRFQFNGSGKPHLPEMPNGKPQEYLTPLQRRGPEPERQNWQSMKHQIEIKTASAFWALFWGVIAFRIANGVVDAFINFWNWLG